jgi:hypothetical protein
MLEPTAARVPKKIGYFLEGILVLMVQSGRPSVSDGRESAFCL